MMMTMNHRQNAADLIKEASRTDCRMTYSKIHSASPSSTSSALGVFAAPTTKTAVIDGSDVEIGPLGSPDAADLDYSYQTSGQNYVDLRNTTLHVQCKVLKADGLPLTHADIAERLASESKELIWNNVQLQELNTTVCGQYCTLYCLLRTRDLTPRQIIDLLHCDGLISHDTRDHIVYDFVKDIYPNKLSALQTDVHDIIDFL